MPIIIKDYQWSQTEDKVTITISLSVKNQSDAENVIIGEKYIKFNFPPYYFELFLANAVCRNESIFRILENNVKFILKKQDEGIWPTLAIDPKKESVMELKREMIQKHETDTAEEYKMRRKQKSELKQKIMDKEMKREDEFRQNVERIQAEMNAAEAKKYEEMKKEQRRMEEKKRSQQAKVPANEIPAKTIPPIRIAGHIETDFTPRSFATPQRESQEGAEREWCSKQNDLKKTIGFCEDDLLAEERNSSWLLAKGKVFYENKNFLAAISAYSAGLKVADKPAELFLNRAEAHFAIRNYTRCAMDASEAYKHLTPADSSDLNERIACLTLRGRALMKLGFIKEGFLELKAALAFNPGNDKLKREVQMIEDEHDVQEIN